MSGAALVERGRRVIRMEPVAVGNAVPEIRAISTVRLEREGGRGAVREFTELLLKARGVPAVCGERYVAERSAVMHGAAQ